MPERDQRSGATYRAFISYSHRDSAAAARLHRRLEGYVLPRRLGTERRLSPIFRDRDELPAADDLSSQVRIALAASQHLIVVCSPDAAASPWVRREIETFRDLHPDRPLLAALIRGEPADAFPPALIGAGREPLAADFRKEGDGSRLALLKLVAGLSGVGLDQLVQRDAQRRLQRVMAVTAASVVGTVVMTGMTVFALEAQAEAQRQRTEAEKLVDFMLDDLRDRLKGDESLSVLSAVNRRAIGYYGAQDLKRLPADSLRRRARVLQAMGEDEYHRSNLEEALALFTEARRGTAALLKANPRDPACIQAHGTSEAWVGMAEWRLGHVQRATTAFRASAALADRLLAIDPRNPDWRVDAADAESNTGVLVLRDLGDPRAALSYFERSRDHYLAANRARPGDPDIQRSLADAYGWIADNLKALGDLPGALDNRRHEAAILEALVASRPTDKRNIRDQLGSALAVSQLELATGQPQASGARLEAAYATATRLAAKDPEDMTLAQQRVVLGLALVRTHWSLPAAANTAQIRALLAACDTPAAAEVEVQDFCMTTRAQDALRAGRTDPQATAYLVRHKARLATIRSSPRWGIDFRGEIASTGIH